MKYQLRPIRLERSAKVPIIIFRDRKMPDFDSVIKEYKKRKEETSRIQEDERRASEKLAKDFADQFSVAVRDVVLPVFGKLKEDLESNGFSPEIKQELDSAQNPCLSIGFFVNPGETEKAHKSEFQLKANLRTLRVEYAPLYDQRPRANKDVAKNAGIESLNRKTLNEWLVAFLKSAFDSRSDVKAKR